MRRTAAAVPVALSVLAAALVVTPAYAAPCAAVAVPPHLVLGRSGLHAAGTFRCTEPATGMTVTVCIEELVGVVGSSWHSLGCATTVVPRTSDSVTGEVVVGVPIASTFLRTVVSAGNDRGDTAGAKSAMMPWFNCACMII